MRETSISSARSSSVPATQTAPSPTASARTCCEATSIGSSASPVAASMRVTVPSLVFATHAAPSPMATSAGRAPTSIWSIASPVLESKRATTPRSALVTHTAPSPTAMPPGCETRSEAAVSSPPRGSRRVIVPSPLGAHTAPSPAATARGPGETLKLGPGRNSVPLPSET